LRRCPGAFLQNLLVLLRQCIPCVAGSQLHLRYAAVLIGHVVPRHLVVLHGIVGRPVVFGGIDLPGFKRRVHVAVSRGLRHCTQQADHVDHDLRILHADGLALQIVQAAHRLTGIERAGTRVVPAQAHPPLCGKVLQKLCSDAAIQHTPHMVGIPVEIRQQQHVEPGQKARPVSLAADYARHRAESAPRPQPSQRPTKPTYQNSSSGRRKGSQIPGLIIALVWVVICLMISFANISFANMR
jgi:hypothetical protein